MTRPFFRLVFLLFIVALVWPLVANSQLSNRSLAVAPLHESDMDYGCGCSFHYPPSKREKGATILQWELGNKANIRVDGSLRKLELRSERFIPDRNGSVKVGDRAVFELQGNGVDVVARCTVVWACRPEDEACEVTWFRGTATVTTERGRIEVPVWAGCGC